MWLSRSELSGRSRCRALPIGAGFSSVRHIHRASVVAAVLLVSALVSVAFATRTFGADERAAAAGPEPAAAKQPAVRQVRAGEYLLTLLVTPNRAPSAVLVRVAITRLGKPVEAARVRLTVTMLDMHMTG